MVAEGSLGVILRVTTGFICSFSVDLHYFQYFQYFFRWYFNWLYKKNQL